MLYGYIIFVLLPRKCTIPIISFWLRFPSVLAVATCQRGQGCFAIGRVGKQFRICWFHFSGYPNRNNPQTKADFHPYRSSLLGYRYGRSRSSGFVGCFLRLRLSDCVPVPRVRSCRCRRRYRYTCRPKLLRFSDDLDVSLDIDPTCGLTR